jgi:hypothetical protein
MTIECYVSKCPFHSCHVIQEEGPFCYEERCRVTQDYINQAEPESCHEALDADELKAEIDKANPIIDEVIGDHTTPSRKDMDTEYNCNHVLTKWPENTKRCQKCLRRPSLCQCDNPKPRLWECRVGVPVEHITDSAATAVNTLYINAPSAGEAWDVLIHIYGADRMIKHVSIKPYKL